jgi:hypothetical protein
MINVIMKIKFGILSTRRGIGFKLAENPYIMLEWVSRVFAHQGGLDLP